MSGPFTSTGCLILLKKSKTKFERPTTNDQKGKWTGPCSRGDEFARGSNAPDPRDGPPRGIKARNIYIPDLHIDTLKQKTRDFR
jgi:error-prone DNA polymerase